MNIGYSLQSAVSKNQPETVAAETMIDRAMTANTAGFDYVQAGDHHAMHHAHYFQNVPTTARLAADINWVGSLFLLPLYNPVLVAEQAGTVASFVKKFDLWCALGYNPDAFAAFGVSLDERVGRFEESLEVIQALWNEDRVTFDGEYFELDEVGVNPKADVHRIVIGGSAEPAVRRAGRLGDAWVAAPSETRDELETKINWYTEETEEGTVIARRDALGLEDNEDAEQTASELLHDDYRGWNPESAWVLSGDAATIGAELDQLAEMGVDEVVVRPMDEAHAKETLEIVGRARAEHFSH